MNLHNFSLFDKNKKAQVNCPDSILMSIKNGDKQIKETFIRDYRPFILKTLSSTLGKFVDESSDEYSIGLNAFNEAIDRFDLDKGSNFFRFSEIVINNRIVDYIRKMKKNSSVYPFSYFEDDGDFEERYFVRNSEDEYNKIEMKEEIDAFESLLQRFGITLEDLVTDSPKHKDSRNMCIKIAKKITETNELYSKMIKKRKIPLRELMEKLDVHQKTVERHRKFIIAVSLIIKSNLEELKSFFKDI